MPGNDADKTGRLVSLAGGILMAIGSLLTWGKVAVSMPGVGTERTSFKGLDTGDGKALLAIAILILAVTLAAFVIRRGVLGAAPVLASLAGGAFALVVGIINAQNVTPTAVEYLVEQAGFGQQAFNPAARDVLEAATNATVGIGLYLVVLGSVVAVVGGLLAAGRIRNGIRQRRSPRDETADVEAVVAETTGEAPPEAPATRL